MEAIEGVVRKVFIWFHNVAAHSEEASKKLFHWNDPIVIDTETVEHAKYLFWQCCRKLRHCSTLLLQDDVACDVFAVDLFGLYDYSAGKTPTDEHSLQLSLKRIEAIGFASLYVALKFNVQAEYMPLADELLAITNCRQTLDLNGVIAVEKSVLKALDFSLYNPNLYYETDPLVVCSYFTNFRTFVESSSVQLKKKTSSALVEYHDAIVEVSQASWKKLVSLARLLCVELALHRENTVLKNRVACKLQKVMASNAFDRLHKKKVAVVTKMFLSAAWQLYRNYDVGIDQLDAAQAKLKNARIQLLSNE